MRENLAPKFTMQLSLTTRSNTGKDVLPIPAIHQSAAKWVRFFKIHRRCQRLVSLSPRCACTEQSYWSMGLNLRIANSSRPSQAPTHTFQKSVRSKWVRLFECQKGCGIQLGGSRSPSLQIRRRPWRIACRVSEAQSSRERTVEVFQKRRSALERHADIKRKIAPDELGWGLFWERNIQTKPERLIDDIFEAGSGLPGFILKPPGGIFVDGEPGAHIPMLTEVGCACV